MTRDISLLSLNTWSFASAALSAAQPDAVAKAVDQLGGLPAVLALQETGRATVSRFEKAGWDVIAESGAAGKALGVAIVGRGVSRIGEQLGLEPDWFMRGAVYPELAERFSERAVAADVDAGGCRFRFASFHATPGTSKGPGGKGVGGMRKPWFHRRVADWMETWGGPYAFAIDANSPDTESLDRVRYFYPAGAPCEAGEDHLLGIAGLGTAVPRHRALDLLRVWLALPAGASSLAEVKARVDGPLMISHYTGRDNPKPKRFDHLWATLDFEPLDVRYSKQVEWVSDHGLVGARVRLTSS